MSDWKFILEVPVCDESEDYEAAQAAAPPRCRTLVLRYTQEVEHRVSFEATSATAVGLAMDQAMAQSGLAYRPNIDPATVRFGVE